LTLLFVSMPIIILVLFFIFKSFIDNNDALHDYNTMMLQNNGNKIMQNSVAIMEDLFGDLQNNHYGIFTTSATSNFADFIKAGIHVDTFTRYVDNSTNIALYGTSNPFYSTAIKSSSQYYDVIAKYSTMNDSTTLTLSDFNNTEQIYHLLIDTLETYDKCNTISNGGMDSIPFPTMKVTIYSVILLVIIAVTFVIFSTYEPIQKTKDYFVCMKLHKEWLVNNKKFTKPSEIHAKKIIDDNLKKTKVNKDADIEQTKMIFNRIIPIITVMVFGVLLIQMISSDSQNFSASLYNGDSFQNNKCV